MASSSGLWDLSGTSKALPSGASISRGTTNQGTSSVSQQSQSSVSSVNTQNIPQAALDALNQLIAQLSDQPRISDAELDKQVPLPNIADYYSQVNHGNPTNPAYARELTPEALARYNNDLKIAQAKRDQIQQKSGVIPGGTASTRESSAARTSDIGTLQKTQGDFTKEAAFDDAGNLSAKFMRQLLEQLMPTINKAAESSGTSGGAVKGLLTQDAAARVAEAQAALGLQTAVSYGQIANQASQILAGITSTPDPTIQALLQALGIAKGTVNQGVSTTSTTGTSVNSSDASVNTSKDTEQQGLATSGLLSQLLSSIGSVPTASLSTGNSQILANSINNPTNDLDTSSRSSVSSRLSNFSF